jgi:TolA-binding protein
VNRLLPFSLVPLLLLSAAAPAQTTDVAKIDKRVNKLESEMRAVQRKVFPGGDPRFFEPEIQAPAATPAPPPQGLPASAPIADLSARVDALEGQLRTLTGQVEAQQFKLRQLEEGFARMKGDVEFRLNALEKPAGEAAPAETSPTAVVPPPAGVPAAKPATPKPAAPAAPVKGASANEDWAAAAPVVRAKDWPAVESAMAAFIANWPSASQIPQARLNLGRSFAGRNQHAAAAKVFLELYQTAPRTIQAPEGLLGLATALNGLAKPKDACKVLAELDSVYGATLKPAQQEAAKAQRTKAKCAA